MAGQERLTLRNPAEVMPTTDPRAAWTPAHRDAFLRFHRPTNGPTRVPTNGPTRVRLQPGRTGDPAVDDDCTCTSSA